MTDPNQTSPAHLHRLQFGTACGTTHPGLVRTTNQDNFLVDDELGLIAVADGMGGHHGGEIASAGALLALRQFLQTSPLVVQGDDDVTIPASLGAAMKEATAGVQRTGLWPEQLLPAAATLFNAVVFANRHLYRSNHARGHTDGDGMGTTLTGFWRHPSSNMLLIFHVGDSRLYRWRDGVLEQLTRDQTLHQQALDNGMTQELPRRNLLLQALGPLPSVQPDILRTDFRSGDVFLCCTDGLYADVPHDAICATVARTASSGLHAACQELVDLAMAHGGKDNVSALLVAC